VSEANEHVFLWFESRHARGTGIRWTSAAYVTDCGHIALLISFSRWTRSGVSC